MSLVIYDTLTKKKSEFVPLQKGQVKMYLCGPTVYGLLHVGNFRGAIFFNLVRQWLEYLGYRVTFVYNYTDVDDKIIDRAKKENVSSHEIAEQYIAEFKKDFARLGLRPHDHNPKVTETMPEIIDMVQRLIDNGKAYIVKHDEMKSEVLYSIASFQDYGKLSHRNPEELKAGVRIEINQQKKDPLDFALWKPSKEGEPAWESPWGLGRPGWHIECSAMIEKILGSHIDIHGGGLDLVFPHHENEIAQSEGCRDHNHGDHSHANGPFVRYWMHNNMINFSGAKMSKSLGNIKHGRSFMDDYHPEILKYMILSVHYRSISDFGEQGIEQSIRGLARIYSALKFAHGAAGGAKADKLEESMQTAWKGIEGALNDDFNTPEAFARVFEVVRAYNQKIRPGMKFDDKFVELSKSLILFVSKFADLTAIFKESPQTFLVFLDDMLLAKKGLSRAQVDSLVNERSQARLSRDFAKSDELRGKLVEMGIAVMDGVAGSTWEVAK